MLITDNKKKIIFSEIFNYYKKFKISIKKVLFIKDIFN